MAPLVIVRWRTPPPSSINERLIIGEDGRARLEVLRPRSFGDAVGSYEGAVEEAGGTRPDHGGPRGRARCCGAGPQARGRGGRR